MGTLRLHPRRLPGPMSGLSEQHPPQRQLAPEDGAPVRGALPPPPLAPEATPPTTGWLDQLVAGVEQRPWHAATLILALLVAVHVAVMNLAGGMTGLARGKDIFPFSADGVAELALLALVAYGVILPSLLARGSLAAFADSAGALSATEDEFEERLAGLADPHAVARLVFGGFWAAVLTPVFGSLLQAGQAMPAAGTGLLAIWLYIRLALVFAMLGASLAYVVLLHYRLSRALSAHLRVDLFDPSALAPLARYMRRAVVLLAVPLLLLGPILSQPEAATASASLLAFATLVILVAAFGGVWGARVAIRDAKSRVKDELNAYSREIWRRAYSNGRIVEAVALPAMAGMLTIRNQIARMANWPGGWLNVVRCLLLAVLPVVTWFGPQAVQSLLQPFL